MNAAAVAVMKELTDINIAYGISDEFRFDIFRIDKKFKRDAEKGCSFVFDRSCNLFQRRERCISFSMLGLYDLKSLED